MGYPARIRRALPAVLRRLPGFLQSSDAKLEVVNRTLKSPLAFPIAFSSETCWAYTSGEQLVLGAAGPAWRGIDKICKAKDTAELVDNFMHFARQYVVRSRIVRVQAAFALTFNITVDFRHADLHRVTIGPESPWTCIDDAHREFRRHMPMPTVRASRRLREFNAWVKLLNPLDPFVHRALFQFWRGCALANSGFYMDAVTALDGVTAVAGGAAQGWHLRQGPLTRRETGKVFGPRPDDQSLLEAIYQLRCAFGAHPPTSKWWDFGELYESEVEKSWNVSRRLIRSLCAQEIVVRSVDPNPTRWSDWFAQNSHLLLENVWFTKLPDLPL